MPFIIAFYEKRCNYTTYFSGTKSAFFTLCEMRLLQKERLCENLRFNVLFFAHNPPKMALRREADPGLYALFCPLFFRPWPREMGKGKNPWKKHKKSHSVAIKPKSGRYPPQRKPAAAVLAVAYSLEISMRPTSLMVRPLLRQASSTRAVSMAVRQGMESSTALRRSFTLSRLGRRPLEEVDST